MSKTVINLPTNFSGRIVIDHVQGTTTIASDDHTPAPASAPTTPAAVTDSGLPAGVEDLLNRHKKHNPLTRSRELTEVFIDRGWEVHEHKRYVRFVWLGKKLELSLYLNSKDLLMKTNEQVLKGQEGTEMSGSGTRIPFNGEDFDRAVEVIELLEILAD